jgi:hypothetical protein
MTGFTGAPGYTNLYYANPVADNLPLAAIAQFWTDIAAYFPTTAEVQVPGEGDYIEDTTGEITGGWSQSAPPAIGMTGSGNYSGASGGLVHWHTDGIVNGRRVRGRTFLVPFVVGMYDTNGSLQSGVVSLIQASALTLVAAEGADLAVWSRPVEGDATATPPIAARAGSSHVVTNASCPDLAAVLRSRRS